MDSKSFDPAKVKAAIHNASPKLEQLFQIIQQVDANDLQMHGHYFKHFIFSDVKEKGYGAKILASAFMAEGYKNLITARAVPGQKALRLTLLPTGADGKDKAFGLEINERAIPACFQYYAAITRTAQKRSCALGPANARADIRSRPLVIRY